MSSPSDQSTHAIHVHYRRSGRTAPYRYTLLQLERMTLPEIAAAVRDELCSLVDAEAALRERMPESFDLADLPPVEGQP